MQRLGADLQPAVLLEPLDADRQAFAGHDRQAALLEVAGQLHDEPGLADPALTPEEDAAARPGQGPPDVPLELGQGRPPADETGPVEVVAQRAVGQPFRADAAQPVEHGDDVSGVAQSLARLLGEQVEDQGVEFLGDVGPEDPRRSRRLLHMGPEGPAGGPAPEGHSAGHAFIEDAADGVEVGPGVDELPPDLLGRHVFRRPLDLTAHLQTLLAAGAEVGGEAEVEQHGRAVGPDDHVLGLDVAMDDPLAVEVGQGLAEPGHEDQEVTTVALGDRLGGGSPDGRPGDAIRSASAVADRRRRHDQGGRVGRDSQHIFGRWGLGIAPPGQLDRLEPGRRQRPVDPDRGRRPVGQGRKQRVVLVRVEGQDEVGPGVPSAGVGPLGVERSHQAAIALEHPVLERLPPEQLHRVPGEPFGLAGLDDPYQPWVLGPGQGVDLATNPVQHPPLADADGLDRDFLAGLLVDRVVDQAHPPLADQAEDPVGAECHRAGRRAVVEPDADVAGLGPELAGIARGEPDRVEDQRDPQSGHRPRGSDRPRLGR